MFRRLKSRVRGFIFDTVKAAMEEALREDSYNIERQLQRTAMEQSTHYILQNIELHKVFRDRYALMKHCLTLAPPTGLILEFGVYKGNSIRYIAEQLPGREIFGFDCFEGLKEPWIFSAEGAFADMDRLPNVPKNVTLIKGMFQETATDFLTKHPEAIALVHVDSDLYSSCKFILETFGQRLCEQSIIVFDELLNYPKWMDGEFKAFHEWSEAKRAKYEFVGFTAREGVDWSGHQVALKILCLERRTT